jgi:hypothetical protein
LETSQWEMGSVRPNAACFKSAKVIGLYKRG